MKALWLILFPFLVISAERRIEVKLPPNSTGHEILIVNYDDEKSAHATLKIKSAKKEYNVSGFYCIKKHDHLLCVGDDDSGNFKIYQGALEIDYIHINEDGEHFIEYKGPKGRLPFR